MMIISRREAKEKGLTRYFTGEPCSKGHVCERFVASCTCFECNKIYVETNKDPLLMILERYIEQKNNDFPYRNDT